MFNKLTDGPIYTSPMVSRTDKMEETYCVPLPHSSRPRLVIPSTNHGPLGAFYKTGCLQILSWQGRAQSKSHTYLHNVMLPMDADAMVINMHISLKASLQSSYRSLYISPRRRC